MLFPIRGLLFCSKKLNSTEQAKRSQLGATTVQNLLSTFMKQTSLVSED